MSLPGPAAVPCSAVVHVRHFVDIFCRLGVVVATAAFATSKFFGANGPRILFASEPRQGCVWKPEVLAISAAWKHAAAVQHSEDLTAELAEYKTTPSVADCQGLLSRAAAVQHTWTEHLAAAAVQQTDALTAELVQLTPAYLHDLTDAKISGTLANKNLLPLNVSEALGAKTVALAHVVKATKAALADRVAGGSPPKPADEDEPSQDEAVMLCADHSLTTAKAALAVIAGCNIVVGGPKQVEEARQLTAKPRPDMPRALWEALQGIAGGTVSGKAKTKAAATAAAASSSDAAP